MRDRLEEAKAEYKGPTLDECEREVVAANGSSIEAQESLSRVKKLYDKSVQDVDAAVRRCRMARFYQESAAHHENLIEQWGESIAELEAAGRGDAVNG